MKKVYIFGTNPLAEMLQCYLSESGIGVDGFTLNKEFIDPKMQQTEKLVAIEDLLDQYSPEMLSVYVTIAYKQMNQVRKSVFSFLKKKGINICSYVHPSAVIAKNAILGEGNIILERTVLQPCAELGDGNIIWSNVNISHHDKIGDFNYFSPGTTIAGRVSIGDLNFFGANSTVSNDICVPEKCLIGAGAYLNQNLQPEQVYVPSKGKLLKNKSGDIYLK